MIWIKYKDQKPKLPNGIAVGSFIVCRIVKRPGIADEKVVDFLPFYGNKFTWPSNYFGSDSELNKSITHWMPLPESPKE